MNRTVDFLVRSQRGSRISLNIRRIFSKESGFRGQNHTCGAQLGGKFLKRDPDEPVDPFFSFAGIPDENKLIDRSRDGGCFAQQNNSGTLSAGREAGKMCRHTPPILGAKNSRAVPPDPPDFWIFQTSKGS